MERNVINETKKKNASHLLFSRQVTRKNREKSEYWCWCCSRDIIPAEEQRHCIETHFILVTSIERDLIIVVIVCCFRVILILPKSKAIIEKKYCRDWRRWFDGIFLLCMIVHLLSRVKIDGNSSSSSSFPHPHAPDDEKTISSSSSILFLLEIDDWISQSFLSH